MRKTKIKCPTCGKPNTGGKSNPFRPFCNERCKLIDLGEWADEKYRIETGEHVIEDISQDEQGE